MSQKEQLLAMLAEYGVFSEADLDKALKKTKIDISIAFIIGICLMMFAHIASGSKRVNKSWGGEALLPAIAIAIVYIADECERYVNRSSKNKGDDDDV